MYAGAGGLPVMWGYAPMPYAGPVGWPGYAPPTPYSGSGGAVSVFYQLPAQLGATPPWEAQQGRDAYRYATHRGMPAVQSAPGSACGARAAKRALSHEDAASPAVAPLGVRPSSTENRQAGTGEPAAKKTARTYFCKWCGEPKRGHVCKGRPERDMVAHTPAPPPAVS